MMNKTIATKKAPNAIGPYAQAVDTGAMVFTSGQLGLVPETGKLAEGVEAQTRQAGAGRSRPEPGGCGENHRFRPGFGGFRHREHGVRQFLYRKLSGPQLRAGGQAAHGRVG